MTERNSIIFIRLPARMAYDGMIDPDLTRCAFVLAARQNGELAITSHGRGTLRALSTDIPAVEHVTLLLSATDVTLLRLPVPPLTGAKLFAALPNLAEDHLLDDPADCAFACGAPEASQRLIGVVRRDWLDVLVRTFAALGARRVRAVPFQLCLPPDEGQNLYAALDETAHGIDLSVRLSAHAGLGLLCAEPAAAMNMLTAIAPTQSFTLAVPVDNHSAYAELANANVAVTSEDWPTWIANAEQTLELTSPLPAAAGARLHWRDWRWPVRLAAACIALNVVGLNLHWWLLAHEARQLRSDMSERYRAAFPNESVVVDPLAQVRQKIALGERAAGHLAADSFVALSAGFGAAWGTLDSPPEIAALDYRDRRLQVRFKDPAAAHAVAPTLKSALAAMGLDLNEIGTDALTIGSRR